MIYAAADPLNGAARDDVLMDATDARSLGLGAGDAIRLTSATGTYDGQVKLARLPTRTLQVHWPEGNVLLPSGPEHREPHSQVPDYNTVVTIARR
jgi:anaerobic selenocysteine-containing dehydrogenase